ncbi:MAG TPA: YoaK family protein [Chitinophaga sp.]|uniref:YoaK family protein n=1 Tax=Chitinophaga sp. TaxID=1869181 RepID=UPI002C8EA3B8|nr:YoaK family protein [Chitinophaga sp.]HVI48937.1 YoaK family protein [Chitinophaga sp.]
MLRHTGRKRNYKHNLRLAVLLCLTAGMVNAAGLLAFSVLTTNVTGHAALLAQKLATGDFRVARMVGLWLLLFLGGAFFTSFCIGRLSPGRKYAYLLPLIIEIVILVFVAMFGHTFDHSIIKTEYFAGSLLFAMGMQNALVSTISGSVVRTTHLTGMFTDLGIDLYAVVSLPLQHRSSIHRKIILRLVIICFFLTGGIFGGYIFLKLQYQTFYLPAGILVITIFYDTFRVRFYRMLRQMRPGNT